MKLDTLKIRNFRGYKNETTIPLENLTAFIGKNDAGKSTILEALEVFFNNSLVACQKEDLSINATDNQIEITCVFSQFPEELVIDAAFPTSLEREYLLNDDGKLEIKKVFPATAAKPKEKVFLVCQHPSAENCNDLLMLKRAELRSRAEDLGVPATNYNANVNASIRRAIWDSIQEQNIRRTELFVDKEDTKKVFETLKNYLPIYALFQSDRKSKDDDQEVADPMKIAIQQALSELREEIDHIKNEVRNRAIATADRTLAKLQEMAPEIAETLVPEFKSEPKFDSQFKLTINSDDDIPINKRGSGVRRLVLLNFFRAEAERLREEHPERDVIFAFEEPETSQHPDHQEMLIRAFIDIANSGNSQVILTTHTPALAGLLPLESLRFVNFEDGVRSIEFGTNEVFEKIASTLGVLADPLSKATRALLLLEGKGDVTFVRHTAETLKDGGFLPCTFEDKNIALVPIGGCGNLKHWTTLRLAEQFNVPYCVLLDSDKGTPEEAINAERIRELKDIGIKAYVTRKREPENYIHLDCLSLPEGHGVVYTDTCDAKTIIGQAKRNRPNDVLDRYWPLMSLDQIREVEKYEDGGTEHFEFTEMFDDLLSIVE